MHFVAWWSIANMLTVAAQGACLEWRFMLGLARSRLAGCFPKRGVRRLKPANVPWQLACTPWVQRSVQPYSTSLHFSRSFPFTAKFPALRHPGDGVGWRMAFILTGALGAGLVCAVVGFFD